MRETVINRLLALLNETGNQEKLSKLSGVYQRAFLLAGPIVSLHSQDGARILAVQKQNFYIRALGRGTTLEVIRK